VINCTLARILLLVSLPMVSWSSHVSIDLLTGMENPCNGTRSVFPGTAGGWPNIYYDDAIIPLRGEIRSPAAAASPVATLPAAHDSAGMAVVEIGHVPGFLGAAAELVAGPALNDGPLAYPFHACLANMLDSYRHSGIDTSAAVTDFTSFGRTRLLSMDRSTNQPNRSANASNAAVARLASKRKDDSGMDIMNPDAPAGQWLRVGYSQSHSDAAAIDLLDWHRPMGEPLALCLIGVVAIIPSMLRRRVEIGGRRSGRRRRSQLHAIPASPHGPARHRADQKSEEDAGQDERPKEECFPASLHD
jgi:hypothetical protein